MRSAGLILITMLLSLTAGNVMAAEEAKYTVLEKLEKLAMTSPVGQRKSGQGWAVSFMMPASYTMETIPVPSDPNVVLREIPAHRAAAIRYSGTWSEKSYLEHLTELQEWMESKNLIAAGEPIWARYNAPFTPWFMRRNEILIPLES